MYCCNVSCIVLSASHMYSHKGIQCIKNAFVIIINANWKVVGSNSLRVLQEFFKWTTGPSRALSIHIIILFSVLKARHRSLWKFHLLWQHQSVGWAFFEDLFDTFCSLHSPPCISGVRRFGRPTLYTPFPYIVFHVKDKRNLNQEWLLAFKNKIQAHKTLKKERYFFFF